MAFDLEAVEGGGSLFVDLHGISDATHSVEVRLNDTLLETLVFEGITPIQAEMDVPGSALNDGQNVLTLSTTTIEDETEEEDGDNEASEIDQESVHERANLPPIAR